MLSLFSYCKSFFVIGFLMLLCLTTDPMAHAQKIEPIDVEGQPLASNASRLAQALEFLGAPLPKKESDALTAAVKAQDAARIQEILDPHALILVTINPESRVKAKRGPAQAQLQQGGFSPILIKVVNESTVTKALNIKSPQALPIYSQGKAGQITPEEVKDRFLDVAMFTSGPMTDKLSGLKVEYAVALIHSGQAGKREAVLHFDVGQGSQDIGFRGEVPILFEVRPAIPVKLTVIDVDGKPTTGRFTFKQEISTDNTGTGKIVRIYPPKSKRLAPDFFFQDQVYRHSGGTVLLPPGELTMIYGRGPEYKLIEQKITVPESGKPEIKVKLERWINAMDHGWYSGDHHIHAAGCAHYTNPTEGVFADDMFLHVKGEALNVGCNLTWGPCYEFQRQFFTPAAHKISEPLTVLKYDIEVSGFGSQALGHVCLLNLRDQTYPGSDGTKTKGWPSWTTPLMKWAKDQGAFTGYAHSGSGLGVNAKNAAKRLLAALDADKDGKLSATEAAKGLLPEPFASIDTNNDGFLTEDELIASNARAFNRLPNLAIPEMDGIGAQEICVTSAQGLCDFISAMDTMRTPEWNCWYHIMNCGFPLKVSGETDFPCITGSRVGQGRVYVQLGKIDKIDFGAWAKGLADGRSYVSDGYAHALQFTVNDKTIGEKVELKSPGKVAVKAKVAFAAQAPLGTAQGGKLPQGETRLVELIVNGQAVASKEVPADDKEHDIAFDIPVERSSWIALRQYPQMHTNPVSVIVDGQPIRASRKSAQWCVGTIEQLWRERGDPANMPISAIDKNMGPKGPDRQKPRNPAIVPAEIEEAHRVFQWAIERFRKIAAECPEGS
ncbi:MAG: CehA/McbA family metallohydrolase [Planctomycetes bacterium]|nr:CehA/McbA family metallohydrolase [Planctomycetota bacterium]